MGGSRFLFVAGVLFSFICFNQNVAAQRYTAHEAPYGTLIDKNIIVGTGSIAAPFNKSFYWSLRTKAQTLLGTPKGSSEFMPSAMMVNAAGTAPIVLGTNNTPPFPFPQFVWKDGGFQPVLVNFAASDMSSNGMLLGLLYSPKNNGWVGETGLYLSGTFYRLKDLLMQSSDFALDTLLAKEMNARGDILGQVYNQKTGSLVPFVAYRASNGLYEMISLDSTGGFFEAGKINDTGCVLQSNQYAQPVQILNRISCPKTKAVYSFSSPPDQHCYVDGFNSSLTVVGRCSKAGLFRWSPREGMKFVTELIDPPSIRPLLSGGQLYGFNNDGAILVQGSNRKSYLLVPVPSPSPAGNAVP